MVSTSFALFQLSIEAIARRCFVRKGVLRNFAKFKKETLTQVFSCEFCEVSKNAFSYRTPPVAASVSN